MEDNNKIGFFKRMAIAIAKPKEYEKLSRQKTRNTIGTISLLALLQTLVLVGFIIFLGYNLITILDEAIKQIPEFSFSNQGLTIQSETPYIYKAEDNSILVVVDSNINMEEVKNNYSLDIFSVTNYILISNDKIELRSTDKKDYFEFSQLEPNKVYTKQSIVDIGKNALNSTTFKVICVIVGIIIWLYFVIAIIFMGLIYSVIAIIVASIEKKKIGYKRLYNISVYAQVTTIFLSIIQLLTLILIPMWSILRSIIICIYIIFGIKGCISDDDKQITTKIEDIEEVNESKEEQKDEDNEQKKQVEDEQIVDDENKGEN